jgi:hypothetical protein
VVKGFGCNVDGFQLLAEGYICALRGESVDKLC